MMAAIETGPYRHQLRNTAEVPSGDVINGYDLPAYAVSNEVLLSGLEIPPRLDGNVRDAEQARAVVMKRSFWLEKMRAHAEMVLGAMV